MRMFKLKSEEWFIENAYQDYNHDEWKGEKDMCNWLEKGEYEI